MHFSVPAADLVPPSRPLPGGLAFVLAGLILLALIVAVLLLVRRSRALKQRQLEEEALERARKKLPQRETAAVTQAEAALEQARRNREAAELRAKEEQDTRAQREASAKSKADAEARAAAQATQRAAELKATAAAATSDEQRREAREEAARAEAEAARRRKEQEQAEKRAAYEAKKGQEAEEKAKRRLDEESRKLEALEATRQKAEEDAKAAAHRQAKVEAESGKTLAEGLEKTRGGFMARLKSFLGGATDIDDRFIAELEEILFTADIGVKTSMRMLDVVREKLKRKELSNPDKVKAALREEIERIVTLDFTFATGGLPPATSKPQVVMIVGVNGSGKTTTIGKLAFKERVNGRRVLLGAGDTFRAAAAEQLDVWAGRAQVDIVKGPADSDPASVCFEAAKKAAAEERDLCIIDTAGRLHTQVNLMAELQKVKRVIDKAVPGAPHEIWLVVDGTTGQNAVFQARQFHEALKLTGLVLTKLDGTAKGGVVIGICDELKVPIRYVGVGEKIGDLRPFSPKEFVDALFTE